MATAATSFQELASSLRDALTVTRVFGEPYEKDGVTVIPVASIGGGGGGGGGGTETDGGSGGGFGLSAKPVGVYVIRGSDVSWEPALDVNKIIGSVTTMLALLLLFARGVTKRRAKRKH